MNWCLRGYFCGCTVVKVWVVEVGGVAGGEGSRAACRCEEIEVTADFW